MAANMLPLREINEVLDLLTAAQDYTLDLVDLQDSEETSVIDFSCFLMELAEKLLILVRNGEKDPFRLIPVDGAGTNPNHLLKTDLLSNIDEFQSIVKNHLQSSRANGQMAPHSPGSTLEQMAMLICPVCKTPIPSSFGVETHKGPASSNTPSMTVRVEIDEGQNPGGFWDLQCPNCQRKAKTHLQIRTNGNGSNLYTVRVSLDQDLSGPRIYERRVLRAALAKLYEAMLGFPLLYLLGFMNKITWQIVSKSMETAGMILGTVDDGSFRHSPWAEPNELDFSPLVKLEEFIDGIIDFLTPRPPPPPPAQ